MGANIVVLFGNCGKDPSTKEVGQNDTLLAEFSVATSKPPRVKGGEWITTWHTVKAFGKTAEKIRDKLRKGDFVAVKGEIEVESWDGQNGKQYRTIVKIQWPDDICIEQRGGNSGSSQGSEDQW